MSQLRTTIPLLKARELLNELHILEPNEIDIERIAMFKDAEVRHEPLQGMDGCIVRDGSAAVITVNNRISFEGQKRFVIAHELGHFFLHPKTRQVDRVTQDQSNNWSDQQEIEEYEANLFAAELLMPTSMFAARIKGKIPSFELIESLQKEFKTTLTAAAVQFVLTTKEDCAIVSCANRQRLWFIVSQGFSFAMLSENFVHGLSCAAEVGANKLTSRSSKVEAGYWLRGYEHDHKSFITEEARYFTRLDRSLSLLWIKDAI